MIDERHAQRRPTGLALGREHRFQPRQRDRSADAAPQRSPRQVPALGHWSPPPPTYAGGSQSIRCRMRHGFLFRKKARGNGLLSKSGRILGKSAGNDVTIGVVAEQELNYPTALRRAGNALVSFLEP